MPVLASITSSELRGWVQCVCVHAQLSCVYLVFTLDLVHIVKCTVQLLILMGTNFHETAKI